jgi:hypothetical protein
MSDFKLGDRVDFDYLILADTKKNREAEVVRVIGEVVRPSGNVKPETPIITIKLDEPIKDANPYMSCRLAQIQFIHE